MKRNKIIAAVLCVLMMTAAFGGCRRPRHIEPETVRISVVAKGYGSEWETEMCKAFKNETGIDAQVVHTGQDDTYPGNAVALGPSGNDIDIFFPTENYVFSQLTQKNFVSGYEGKAWADLTDVYEAPAEGYKESGPDFKIKNLVNQQVYDGMKYSDGKPYMVSYATSITGLLYNKTLWDSVNAKLPVGNKLELPRTTDEMTALFDRLVSLKNGGTTSAYPYVYSGANDYTSAIVMGWWAQYDGKEKAFAALQGKYLEYNAETGGYDDKGYSAKIFDTDGRQYSFQAAKNLFKNNYNDSNDSTKVFTQAQLDFLKSKAFFNVNGDWMEREVSNQFNPGDVDVAYIKLPVVSQIVNHPVIKANDNINDAQLSAILAWIDGGEPAASKPAVSDTTLNFLRDARKFNGESGACARVAHVAAYSPRLESAKKFLRFMYSKQGQEIIMKTAYGTICPINADMTQFDFFNKGATVMARSKIELFQNSYAFGQNNASPMQYLGGLAFRRYNTRSPSAFGSATPAEIRAAEYTYFSEAWAGIMSKAGVS